MITLVLNLDSDASGRLAQSVRGRANNANVVGSTPTLANTFDIIDYESKTLGQCGGRTHNIHVTSMTL